jgi:hypothetical protein
MQRTKELWIQIEEMHKISISMGNRPVDLSKLSSTSKLKKKILSKLAKKVETRSLNLQNRFHKNSLTNSLYRNHIKQN